MFFIINGTFEQQEVEAFKNLEDVFGPDLMVKLTTIVVMTDRPIVNKDAWAKQMKTHNPQQNPLPEPARIFNQYKVLPVFVSSLRDESAVIEALYLESHREAFLPFRTQRDDRRFTDPNGILFKSLLKGAPPQAPCLLMIPNKFKDGTFVHTEDINLDSCPPGFTFRLVNPSKPCKFLTNRL